MKKHKVLFTEKYLTKEGKKFLEDNNCEVIVKEIKYMTDEEMIDFLKDFDAIIAGGENYREKVLKSLKNLKIIARLGVGYEKVDIAAAEEAGIIITNTPGTTDRAVSEMTLALMLSLLRRIPWFNNELKQGIWKSETTVTELSNSLIGIVGMGHIGKDVIRLLQGFGCKIFACDLVWDEEFARKYNVERLTIEELFEKCDFISIHVPLGEQTRGMIGRDLLRRMKLNAYIINTSRGAIIDKAAIKEVLQEKLIAGAAIDAFWEEPCMPDDDFLRLENLIATPHVAYNTYECRIRNVEEAAREVVAVLSGKEPRFRVHK